MTITQFHFLPEKVAYTPSRCSAININSAPFTFTDNGMDTLFENASTHLGLENTSNTMLGCFGRLDEQLLRKHGENAYYGQCDKA